MGRRVIKCSPQTVVLRKKDKPKNIPTKDKSRQFIAIKKNKRPKRAATQDKDGKPIYYGGLDDGQLYAGTHTPNKGVYGKDSGYRP